MQVIGPLVCPVLVGRDDLLALAERRLAEAKAGRGHVLFLAGEAGVGKTRLLGSIERVAAASGFRVARGGTYPGDLEVPGAIFLELARAMRRTDALAPAGERVAARLSALDVAREGDAHRRRRLLTLDLADDLAAAASAPTLLALEDLHQADDLTLEVLATVARRVTEVPLLIVATYRSDELYPRVPMRDWRARLLAQRQAEEARLRRLTLDETATMASLLLASGQPVPRDVAAGIHDRTDGIPLHVEELIALMGAAGGVGPRFAGTDEAGGGRRASVEPQTTGGHRDAGGPGAGGLPEVPDTLEDAILGRIALRSAAAQQVARIGSVIGRSFELDLLAGVAGDEGGTIGSPDGLADPLAELADHFLLAPSTASGRYGFRHALICDAIYARIPELERRRLHARVAAVASSRGDFSDAFLSLQLERARDAAGAHAAALRAARTATAISAHREAFDLWARALRHAPRDLPPADRAALLEAFARAAAAIDGNGTAAAAFGDARAAWLAAGRPLDAAEAVVPLAAARHLLGAGLDARLGLLAGARAEVDEARRSGAADADGATRAAGRIEAGIAAVYMLNRHLDDGIAHATTARDLARAAGDGATVSNAEVTLASCLSFSGRVDEAFALLEGHVQAARAARAEAEASRGYRMLGSCASVLVAYDGAERWLREGIDYAERAERWNDHHYMAAHLGHVLWATGRWDEAAAIAEQALLDGRGGITTRITALHVLGYVALGRGDGARAVALLEEARAEGVRMGEIQRLSPALWGLAEAASLDGDAETAIRWSEAGRAASHAVRDATYLYPFAVTGTRAYLAASDPAGAARFLDAVEADLRHRSIPGTLPAIDHARGLLVLATGGSADARRLLATAVGAWSLLGRSWEGAWALVDLARAEVRANRRQDALRHAAAAEASATAMGSRPLVAAARALGRRRGAESDDSPWSPLTAREWEVASLVAEGLTNADVADRLGVAPKTVSAHVEHILAKLGVGRRAEVAAWVATIRARRAPPG